MLRQLHDELDAAVLEAYDWSDLLPLLRVAHGNDAPAQSQTRDAAARAFEESVLERLVALNAERAAEEARGHVRWLRPEFQNRDAHPVPQQSELETRTAEDGADESASAPAAKSKPKAWPKDPIDQVRAVADILAASSIALAPEDVAARFTARGAWKKRIDPLLRMLVALGRATEKDGQYRARP